jgi:hypothetical protein
MVTVGPLTCRMTSGVGGLVGVAVGGVGEAVAVAVGLGPAGVGVAVLVTGVPVAAGV